MSAAQRIALALDPGVTTGYCIGRLSGETLILEVGEAKLTPYRFYQFVRSYAVDECDIIFEDFQYRNAARMGLNLMPVKLIGIIELIAEQLDAEEMFFKQSASLGKGHYSDEKLKEMGLWKVGKRHGRDATKHLLHWCDFGPGMQWYNLGHLEVKLREET